MVSDAFLEITPAPATTATPSGAGRQRPATPTHGGRALSGTPTWTAWWGTPAPANDRPIPANVGSHGAPTPPPSRCPEGAWRSSSTVVCWIGCGIIFAALFGKCTLRPGPVASTTHTTSMANKATVQRMAAGGRAPRTKSSAVWQTRCHAGAAAKPTTFLRITDTGDRAIASSTPRRCASPVPRWTTRYYQRYSLYPGQREETAGSEGPPLHSLFGEAVRVCSSPTRLGEAQFNNLHRRGGHHPQARKAQTPQDRPQQHQVASMAAVNSRVAGTEHRSR